MIYEASTEIGGNKLTIEVGRVAKQANGAAMIKYGETVVLVTACAQKEPRENVDFLPLTVDYREYTFAAGKFPGGFHKREGKPSEKEILTSRLIDRPLRPLFPDNYHNETQVIAFVFSADGENDPDILSIIGASSSLFFSDIPFTTPIGAVRMGFIDGELVVNPTTSMLEKSALNLVVAGSEEAMVMVESWAKEISEELISDALFKAHEEIKKTIKLQRELFDQIKPVKWVLPEEEFPHDMLDELKETLSDKIRQALYTPGKLASEGKMKEYKKELIESYPEENEEKRILAGRIFDHLKENIFRNDLLEKRIRPDGRSPEEIRPISIEIGLMPRTHGSALFTRGETQALATVTLGTSEDSQIMDTLDGESNKTFMVHYNFPPFSVGEVAFLRGPGRREIGHGALAEKALRAVVPSEEDFPYTVRVVSNILESNGSSSMATVCGGSLALMDAGVPVTKAVSGIAMGLIKEGERYMILSDIAGFEDHYGDMDFKVAGTADGITALQMDIKIQGITPGIMKEALEQAKKGRMYILEKMNKAIDKPRDVISPYAPRIFVLQIPVHRIKDLIGPGGKNIRNIIDKTNTKIDVDNDGTVKIFAVDEEMAKEAEKMINELCEEAEMGKVYTGKVTRIESYGAFVEIFPGTEGLLHISEVSHHRIRDIKDEINVGDEITVKVIGIDPPNKIKLSIRALTESPEETARRSGRRSSSSRSYSRRNDRDKGGRRF